MTDKVRIHIEGQEANVVTFAPIGLSPFVLIEFDSPHDDEENGLNVKIGVGGGISADVEGLADGLAEVVGWLKRAAKTAPTEDASDVPA